MAATDVEDDIYAGYNDYPSVYNIKDLEQDDLFQEVIRTSYGKRSMVSVTDSYYIIFIDYNAIISLIYISLALLYFFYGYLLTVYSKDTRYCNAFGDIKQSK